MTGTWRSPLAAVVGLVLLAAWALLSTPSAPEAGSAALAHLAAAGGLAAGVVAGRYGAVWAGLAVVAGVVVAFLLAGPDAVSGDPLAPPLGYANANGALAVCGAAGAVLAARRRSPLVRGTATAAALLVAVLCWQAGAQAAAATAVLLAGWSLVRRSGRRGVWLATGTGAVVVAALLPVAWGAGWLTPPGVLVDALSEERIALWSEAVEVSAERPVRGVGPGNFSQVSPTAADPDLAWAHSVWLQESAELGLVGVVLLAVVVAWLVVLLGRDAPLVALLLLPATIDYVFHFGVVVVAASFVVGGWLGSSSGRGNPWLTPPSP